MDELTKMQAEICKIFSSPVRLKIIKLICNKEISASEILKKTGLSKANLSQHMAMMIAKGLVEARKEGQKVYYRIVDENVIKACKLMQNVVKNTIKRKTKMLK